MGQVVHVIFIDHDPEFTGDGRRNLGFGRPSHEGLLAHAIFDEIGNGNQPDVVFLAEFFQGGHAGHGAVIVHDFADHTGWPQAGQAGQVNRSLGLAGTHHHPALAGPQGENMPGADQIGRFGVVAHGGLNRDGAVGGRNAGGHPAPGFNRYGEAGFKR